MLKSIPFKPRLLTALMLGCFAGQAATAAIVTYAGDPGTAGDPASWRTPEFMRSFGLRAMGAEYAYAAGFAGAGVPIGLVDSGFYFAHPDLPASRYTPVTVNGVSGTWNAAYNDSHGTGVSGLAAGSRDGNATTNFHGVAFNSQVYMGNTLKGDGALFGVPQATQTVGQTIDQAYIANVYRAVAATPGVRIVGTSWGSQPNTEQYQTLRPTTGTNLTGRAGALGNWAYLTRGDTWFQGALDAWATGDAINFSNGNTGYLNSSPRSGAAYFRPELEGRWTAVTGIQQSATVNGTTVGTTYNADGSVNIPGVQVYNQCGYAKWSCVSAPSAGTVTSNVGNIATSPTAGVGTFSGTSAAQPHATAALALIMERFPYMTNEQAVMVMRTTAVQNATINNSAGAQIINPTAGQIVQVPDDRNGWGTVSLRNAMNGPGQFMGNFAVNTQGQNDTWSNNISDVAIRARQAEDQTEATAWAARKAEKGWNVTPPPPPPAVPTAAADQQAYYASDAVNDYTEYQVGLAREAARNSRVYNGSLTKLGAGALTLTGMNSYTGGTQVMGGTLVAGSRTALGTGNVSVGNATLATRVADSPLMIAGNLTLGPDSVLDLGFSRWASLLLDVDGVATLNGLLQITFPGNYSNAPGLFDLMDFASSTGAFRNVSFVGLNPYLTASLVYSANGIDVLIASVPEPATYALALLGLGCVGWASRRRRKA
ncbi:S8 family serine peptidase [Piscinibacter koreensis]|uniref:S8 family serine peptidase n=1 Tax=Piscinibacter koreensis TaxID=2742824 RepID=A0A7Y6TX40_9BURK|nr:S8 family serine peptidase [Schlegelella koreensis]NUZ06680.1 S8 family serine peptidase [Schlegelella koreensis]